jgi:hypothetical protein
VGCEALWNITTGDRNTAVGYQTGYLNKTGRGNVFLGYMAGGKEHGSNTLYIANSDSNNLICGDFSYGSIEIGTTYPNCILNVHGNIYARNLSGGDIIFQKDGKKLWRMFEDEEGLYAEKLDTGRVYSLVLKETEDKANVDSPTDLKEQIEELRSENDSLKHRIEALEKVVLMQKAVAKEVQQ